MKQSRLGSLTEAFMNIMAGFAVSILAQLWIFPLFGIHVSLEDNVLIGGAFTLVSLVRSYALRRLFESFRNV